MKLELDGIHTVANQDVSKYIQKKIGGLDKYVPRHASKSAHALVILRETKIKNRKECMCEVIMKLPGETITAKESTMNMFASVDIVEEKIKSQLRRYKDKHSDGHYSPIKRLLRKIRS